MPITYENDFYGWTQEQANLIRKGQLTELDTQNLLEEIEAMGRRERHELESRLEVLLAHLLKWQYQDSHRGKSWILTIKEQRRKIMDCIKENPSLKNQLDTCLIKSYEYSKITAAKETGISENVFPECCPWKFNQIMDSSFLPE